MQSSAWMNGMCPPVRPYSQAIQTAAQITHYTMQQAATANNSCQYMTANTGVQPTQIAVGHYDAYSNRQPSNWQNSAAPQQAVTFQQTAGGNNYHQQHSPINTQSGNPSMPVTCGFQQNFHQNHAQNSSTQRPTEAMTSNATYPQQDASAHWNQSVPARGHVNHGDPSDHRHRWDQSGLYHNVNGEPTKLVPVYTTTATSPPVGQTAYTATAPAPAAAEHNRQTSHDHHHRQNVPQRGSPPAYGTIMSFRSNSVTTNSSSSGQNLHISNTSQHYTTHYNGGEAAASSTMNPLSYSRGNETRPKLDVRTQLQILRQGTIQKLVDCLRDPVDTSLPSGVRKRVRKMGPVKAKHGVKATQQRPNVPHVTAPGDKRGNRAANEVSPITNVRLSAGATQLMHLLEKRSANRSSVAKNCEMLSAAKANDAAVHSSPGRTRAVAVVQPLSQESYQVAGKQTGSNTTSQADGSPSCLEKLLHSPENNKQVDCLSVGPYQNQMAGEPGCVPAVAMQADQRVAPTAQQSAPSEDDKDKSEMPTDPKGVLELSSVPTIPWTPVTLNTLIQDSEKAQTELKDAPMCKMACEFLSMLRKGESKKCAFQMSMYRNLKMTVKQFCIQHVTRNAVILSQVADGFEKQLDSYRVLKHDEVYSQPPYESSWLNVNEQLDDIDKEFDFPQCLKHHHHHHHHHRLESENQPDQVETDSRIVAQTVNEASSKMSSSTEREHVDSLEEKQVSTAEAIPTSPKKTDCDDSSDPYTFEIQVLSPEEAKVIFKQAQNWPPKSMDTDDQTESDWTGSVEEAELPEVTDATSCDSNPENKSFCPIEEVCCIVRWKEIIWDSNAGSLSKCKCKNVQSHEDITAETLDEEETAVQNKDEIIHQAAAPCWPELCSELGEPIYISEDDDGPHPYSDEDPKNLSHISLNSSVSSIILISDEEDKENDTPSQMPNEEIDSDQAWVQVTDGEQSSGSDEKETEDISSSDAEIHSGPEVESTGNTESCTPSVGSDKEFENLSGGESEVASQISDLNENSGVRLTKVAESSLETEEQTEEMVKCVKRTKKRQRTHDRFYPVFKKSKKCKSLAKADSQPALGGASKCETVTAHAADGELSASSVRTAELVLFGSRAQDKGLLLGGRKKHISSGKAASDSVPRPPKVVTVQLSPLKRKSSKTVRTWECSIQRLCKKWKVNISPTKMRLKRTTKAQERSFPSLSEEGLEKEEKGGSANAEEWSVSLQNQNVLKFSVLPKSFDFKDGTNGSKKTSDPIPDKPKSDLFEQKNKSHKRAQGTWYPLPEKKRRLFPPPTTKPCGLFHEFQKKYMDKIQSDVNA